MGIHGQGHNMPHKLAPVSTPLKRAILNPRRSKKADADVKLAVGFKTCRRADTPDHNAVGTCIQSHCRLVRAGNPDIRSIDLLES